MKRYRLPQGFAHQMLPEEHPAFSVFEPTDYVLHSDALALEQENARLREAVAATRPSVRGFALRMEAILRKHDAKKGGQACWLKMHPGDLLARLREEAREVAQALDRREWSQAADEAVDVANFALMIADACVSLPSDSLASAAIAAAREGSAR